MSISLWIRIHVQENFHSSSEILGSEPYHNGGFKSNGCLMRSLAGSGHATWILGAPSADGLNHDHKVYTVKDKSIQYYLFPNYVDGIDFVAADLMNYDRLIPLINWMLSLQEHGNYPAMHLPLPKGVYGSRDSQETLTH